MHDIHVAVAKHYVENLKEEVKKGMREKAEEGIYPGRAPIGYRNNPATRTIDVDPERAPMIRRIFELYATGEHSLITLRKAVLNELGLRLARLLFRDDPQEPVLPGIFRLAGSRIQRHSSASDFRAALRSGSGCIRWTE